MNSRLAQGLLSNWTMSHINSDHKRLMNLSPVEPSLKGAELVMVADCAPRHSSDILHDSCENREVVVGCPIVDDYSRDVDRLVDLLWSSGISGLTVVTKNDQCCVSLSRRVREAVASAGNDVLLRHVVVDDDGEVLSTRRSLGIGSSF